MNTKTMCKTALMFLCVTALLSWAVHSDAEDASVVDSDKPPRLTLVRAVMSEGVRNQEPINKTVIFSISAERAFCFSAFDPVPEDAFIYHNWMRRDHFITKIKLAIHPPKWSTYSNINLREIDKGPWQVVVTDEDGNILKTLMFSVTE